MSYPNFDRVDLSNPLGMPFNQPDPDKFSPKVESLLKNDQRKTFLVTFATKEGLTRQVEVRANDEVNALGVFKSCFGQTLLTAEDLENEHYHFSSNSMMHAFRWDRTRPIEVHEIK